MTEKNSNSGLINAKKVSIQREIPVRERAMIGLSPLKFFNIQKQHLIYTNII